MLNISFCIPTYNFAPFLDETFNSILPQMREGDEIILLDGGSSDETPLIGHRYAEKWPAFHYHRREQRGGIDRDISLAVSHAKGDYIWLFSSDDILKEGALTKLREELKRGDDVYLAGFTVCGYEIKRRYWDHPILKEKLPKTYNFQNQKDRKEFFEKALTTSAFFSFMGSCIVKRTRWEETSLPEMAIGSCYAHAYRIFLMQEKGLFVRYLAVSLIDKRGFNDSFLEKGVIHRLSITIDGYFDLGERLFGKESMEAYCMRQSVIKELPLKMVLITAKSQIQNDAERKRLDDLVKKLYQDPSLINRVRKTLYFLLPERALASLSFIYRHRSFFKYLRLQRLKHFLKAAK